MTRKHMVISSYNCDPTYLIDLGIPYTIYDQSDEENFVREILKFKNVHLRPNVGHSLSNIFEYISINYEELPDMLIFVKANIVPRHCTEEYFRKNIKNNYFTHLFHLSTIRVDQRHSDYLAPGYFLEANDSWYVSTKHHSLFCTFDEFYQFLFVGSQVPSYLVFSPGACYVVESERIRNYPKTFWQALNKISSYQHFPSEAFMVERALSMIFSSKIQLQPWVNDSTLYESLLDDRMSSPKKHTCKLTFKRKVLNRISITRN
jgi:hypothetical protein